MEVVNSISFSGLDELLDIVGAELFAVVQDSISFIKTFSSN
jgi:hypothetical protein